MKFFNALFSASGITALLIAGLFSVSGALVAQPVFASTISPNSNAGLNLSYNWAGYVSDSGAYTSITGSWVIPSASASQSTSADATWVGIGGVDDSDLIQVGTQTVFSGGTAQYQAWYEMLPNVSTQLPVAVKSGDSITASLQEIGTGVWSVSLRDNTTGQSDSITVDYASSLSSAEWIEEMPTLNNGFLPLDNFGVVTFTSGYTTMNGEQETILGSNAGSLDMIANANQALAVVSGLGTDGASFSVSRTSAVATSTSSSSGVPYSVTYRLPGQGTTTPIARPGVGVRGLQRSHPFGRAVSQTQSRRQFFSAYSFSFGASKLLSNFFHSYER